MSPSVLHSSEQWKLQRLKPPPAKIFMAIMPEMIWPSMMADAEAKLIKRHVSIHP
jgi:hypothetical protein